MDANIDARYLYDLDINTIYWTFGFSNFDSFTRILGSVAKQVINPRTDGIAILAASFGKSKCQIRDSQALLNLEMDIRLYINGFSSNDKQGRLQYFPSWRIGDPSGPGQIFNRWVSSDVKTFADIAKAYSVGRTGETKAACEQLSQLSCTSNSTLLNDASFISAMRKCYSTSPYEIDQRPPTSCSIDNFNIPSLSCSPIDAGVFLLDLLSLAGDTGAGLLGGGISLGLLGDKVRREGITSVTADDAFGAVRAVLGGIPWSEALEVTNKFVKLLARAGQVATATDAGIIAASCGKGK